MGEWLKPAVLKTVELERVPGVRIPLPPPISGPCVVVRAVVSLDSHNSLQQVLKFGAL
jgi:hypothetical protein